MFRRRVFPALWISVILAACAAFAPAQDENPRSVDTSTFGERVTLGPNWLFKAGDDPAWASPTLDDSGWQIVDTQHKYLFDYGVRNIRFAWYRIHLHLRAGVPDAMVALDNANGSYQVYANGTLLGSAGGAGVSYALVKLHGFRIPAGAAGPAGDLVIALRFRVNPSGSHGPGNSSPLDPLTHVCLLSPEAFAPYARDLAARAITPELVLSAFSLVVGAVALGLFIAMRGRREYLVAFFYLLANAAYFFVIALNYVYDYSPASYLLRYIIFGLTGFTYIEFIRVTLNLPRTRRLLALQVLIAICGTLLPPSAEFGIGNSYFNLLGFFGPLIAVDSVILVLLFRALRASNREARVLLPAVFLLSVEHLWWFAGFFLYLFHISRVFYGVPAFPVGSYRIGLAEIAFFVLLAAVLLFLVVRTVGIARRQAQAVLELEAAREVQQQLVPAVLPAPPGFHISAAYRPAAEVGGDFYQVIEQSGGAFLVVIGDVSGKGLKAAMTSALALGALRALAAENLAPAQLLERLNAEALRIGGGGLITCLCARVAADGTVTLANAGHLPPYRNGEEIVLEHNLPLGMAADTAYSETLIRLAPGEALTLLSDGVVEARNASKELFGFERTAKLTTESPEQVAQAAQAFGQEDDITVLTVAFAA